MIELDKFDEEERKIAKLNGMTILPRKEIKDNPEYNKQLLKMLEKLENSKEFYSKIEKDKKNKLNPRLQGIFIMFDNIDYYFQQFQKFQFFENYETTIPKSLTELEDSEKIFESIEDYIKENTSIQHLLNSNKINFDDIISDYILYFISKRDRLTKDSSDIKFIYKILSSLIQIKKSNEKLDEYKYFIEIIILFNIYGSYITYPLNAIKYLKDEKLIDDIYTKILKEIAQYEKETNVIFIIIESLFNVLINEILLNREIIPKIYYIHLFLMNIINTLNLSNKSFYLYMQFRALYDLIKKGYNTDYLKDAYTDIYKLKDVFININNKDEVLECYNNFYQKIRSEFNEHNYKYIRIFIVDYFYYELKKYKENEELFPIIIDVLSEDNGNAFIGSNKIFNIFLKKYLFEKPPENKEECRNILEKAFQIKNNNLDNDKNKNNVGEKNEQKKEEGNEIKEEENKNEIKLEPKKEIDKEYKGDLFLKKYNELKENEKLKTMMDEIIQQVFGFYFNAYFMSFLDKINSTHSFKDSDDFPTNIFYDNQSFLEISIEYLENIRKPFNGREISIFLANAFIQSFLYIFIKYFYNNINEENEYKGKYDITEIFNIIKGKSGFKRVLQIYVFRLIYYNICEDKNDNSFERFKKFGVKNDVYNSFVEQFKEKYSFDDPPFKLIFYCKKLFEDFFNNENQILPINYTLNDYEIDSPFPYDNNIINIKMINNNLLTSTKSINIYENNSQLISRLAVLIISNASKDLINDNEQYREINNNLTNIFKNKNKAINAVFNEALFELTGDLLLNLINEFKKLLKETSEKDSTSMGDKDEMKKEGKYYIPKINSSNFTSNSNEINKYNQRVIGIFLYALKISLTNFIFDDREKYFYSYLIMTQNSSKEIINILDNSYIPGFDLVNKGLKEQNNNKDYYYDNWDSSISSLTLRFILYSNLLFNLLIKQLNENDLDNYTIKGSYSCLRTILCNWNALEIKLINKKIPIIEIYFNLIIKYLPFILKKCTLETIKDREKTENFVDTFKKFISKCLDNYEEYSLNFIDKRMKCIIQELNNPLKYDFDEFPFLTYYSIQSKPNRDKIINEIDNGDNYLILNNFFKCTESKGLEIEKINKINLGKYYTYSINDNIILSIKQLEQYKKLYDIFKTQYEGDYPFVIDFEVPIEAIKIHEYYNSKNKLENEVKDSIREHNILFENLINDKIKKDSSYKYLFNEIYEEKEFFDANDFELINLQLSDKSKYKHYTKFISEYIYRNNFKSDHSIDYFHYKKFDINLKELDEHLFSILLFNKKILLDIDYSKKIFFPKFDLFNKISGNENILTKYLFEYPKREELTQEQIKNINYSINKIINSLKINEYKNEIENKIKQEIDELQKDIDNKKKTIEEDNNNLEKNEENEFIKYDKLLKIKNIDKEIEQKQYLIDILNFKYDKALSSIKVQLLMDLCFTLQHLLYYIFPLNLNEEIPLLYICSNLKLFKLEKEKLIHLLELNENLKLSQLFSLYEYLEYLIFPAFIYQINNGYMTKIPIYLSKKILYIFDNEEIRSKINFTKIEIIDAIRKCLSRYISSSIIKKNFIIEDLNKDLLDLLVKEDLWTKNKEIHKIKESFIFIDNYLKFPLKVKHIFNFLEILIGIEEKDYLCLDNFKEEEKKEKEKKDIDDELIFLEEKKEDKKEEPKKEEKEKINLDLNKSFGIKKAPDEFKKNLNLIKRRQKFIHSSIQNSKFIEKFFETIKISKNDNNNNHNNNLCMKDLFIDVFDYGRLFKEENILKKFNNFIENPKIDINFTKLKEKKNIDNFGNNITDIIVYNKNKTIVSYSNKIINFYLFDRKTFRKQTIFTRIEIKNLKGIKNLDDIWCMKEIINGTLLLGSRNGYIMNIQINELKKNNKSEYTAQLLNQCNIKNSNTINKLIEINNNSFISNDEEKNNVLWQNFEIKKELNKGIIAKLKNNLIIFDTDFICFYDIKKNFEEIGKIEMKLRNHTILNDNYMIAEDDGKWEYHLINLEEKKEIKKKKYKPKKSFILEKICDEWAFRLEKDKKIKLINIKLVKDNNEYDVIPDNNNSIIIENGDNLISLFDEFFIIRKEDGNINCYGCF